MTSVRTILLADADPATYLWLRAIIAGHFWLVVVDTGRAALGQIAAGAVTVVVIGTRLADMSGAALLERIAGPVVFALDDGPVSRRLVRTMPADLVLERFAAELPPGEVEPVNVERIGAAADPAAAAREIVAAVVDGLDADRARCLYCDEDTGELWSPTDDLADGASSGGIAGAIARSIAAVALSHAEIDPAYASSIDDPGGSGRERIAVQPVVAADGRVHAVIIAVRSEHRSPFSGGDLARLEALAAAWAPHLLDLATRPAPLFRREAIEHLMRRGARGDVVRIHPGWIRAAYWLVLASLAGAVAFAALARVRQYAEGPAVVRFTGRSDVVALEPGTIAALEVSRGGRVTAGQVLARLSDTEEAAHLHGLDLDFERRLVSYLQTPADPAVRAALAEVVSQRASARASVESRVIRAPADGIVTEVLVRNGQHVDAGKVVMTLVENGSIEGVSVFAFLPGGERPRVHAHQHLRLSLSGYRGAQIGGEVRAVSSEVLGAAEARARYLGERLGDSVPITGTVVVVEARLASPVFEAEGQRYQLHDGMLGIAEVQLESRSVLETLIPWGGR